MIGNGDLSVTGQLAIVEGGKNRPTNLEVLGNLTNETLEWKFANEKFCRLLVTPDFTEGDGTRSEAMGFLDSSSCVLQSDFEEVSFMEI